MRKKTLWLTRTAAMLALLIALQWATKPLGQFVTGSCVNAVLAVCVLCCGVSSGITVALLSPLFACLLKIAPSPVIVPVIMIGNSLYVILLSLLSGKKIWKNAIAWISAAVAKFAAMYALMVWVICGLCADFIIAQGFAKGQPPLLFPGLSWSRH